MKKLLSLLLVLVTLLGIIPTSAFAADSVEAALGEVDIYNGGYELGYLSINGAVKKQDYTYFMYKGNDGTTREVPAYCVNPYLKGVPQKVEPGQSIKYLAEERSSDSKVVGIISNGYPHRSLSELKLDNKYQAYYATKMALWCYLIPSWNINNLKVAPGLTGAELDRGNRILAAAKDIYKRGTTYNYMLIDPALVGHLGVGTEIHFLISLVPDIQPVTKQNPWLWLIGHRLLETFPQLIQLCHTLRFGFCQNVLGDWEALFIAADHISALPAPVLPQVDAAVSAFSALCHGAISSPR